jgi:predicted TPR repeat methyltransferase
MATQDNDFHSKETSLRSFLAEKPKNAKSISQLSSLLVDRSKELGNDEKMRDEAISLAKRAIQVAPRRPFGYAALSIASRNFLERLDSLQKAADLSTHAQLIPRVGFLLRLLLEPREEESHRVQGIIGKSSNEHPSRRDLNPKEIQLYTELEKLISSAWTLELSLDQKEFLSKHEYRLGLFFRKKQPSEIHQPRARKHFQKLQQQRASNSEMASFWLATMGGEGDEIFKCPADYIVSLYSTFAERFDELLVEKLNYQTPTKLREVLNLVCGTRKFDRGVDLGCGTGLSGLAFSDIVHDLTGVDLSPEMIEKAKQRNCYKELIVGDVTSALSAPDKVFDLVLACDVFCYIGDLSEVFTAVSRSLSKTGFFCFSTELLEESTETSFRLHSCARFSHKRSYLEELACNYGFEIVKLETASIRKNQGEDVRGMLAVFKLS